MFTHLCEAAARSHQEMRTRFACLHVCGSRIVAKLAIDFVETGVVKIRLSFIYINKMRKAVPASEGVGSVHRRAVNANTKVLLLPPYAYGVSLKVR